MVLLETVKNTPPTAVFVWEMLIYAVIRIIQILNLFSLVFSKEYAFSLNNKLHSCFRLNIILFLFEIFLEQSEDSVFNLQKPT